MKLSTERAMLGKKHCVVNFAFHKQKFRPKKNKFCNRYEEILRMETTSTPSIGHGIFDSTNEAHEL